MAPCGGDALVEVAVPVVDATADGLAGVAGGRPSGLATVAPWAAAVVAAAGAGADDGGAARVADGTVVATFGAPAEEAAGAIFVLEELEEPAPALRPCATTVAGPEAAAAPVVAPPGAAVGPGAARPPASAIETLTPAGWDDSAVVDTLTPDAG